MRTPVSHETKTPSKKIISTLLIFDGAFILTSVLLKRSFDGIQWELMLVGSVAYFLGAMFLNFKDSINR
ncbi:hypothetical protein [Clostridium sp. YIM B02551]|uniref:hypothetical protein n=1 Tax=Clostridium sp. YIM B02551 TaxID=2910679 RepID=UPI001EEC34EC|nr:hypothetical protein [Clostridium sp. YIM B02551]